MTDSWKWKFSLIQKNVPVQQIFVQLGRHVQRIKILRKEHAYKTKVIKMVDGKDARNTLNNSKVWSIEEF